MITQPFELNMIPDQDPVVVHVDQYDHGTGRLRASLYDNDSPYSPSGMAYIQGKKPDDKGFAYSASLSGNVVTADLTEQMTAVAGDVRTQIVIQESSGRTGTFAFILRVQRSALPDDTNMSASDYALIERGIEAAEEALQAASEAEDSADAAAGSATAAANSATAAAGSATAAANSATAAAGSASSAATSAHNAESSSSAAALSQTAAAVSERNAQISAGEAADSADDAAENKRITEVLQAQAGTYARAAADSESNAEAWARGTRGGQDVPASDETYQNNSFWYSQRASGSAATAESILDDVRDAGENAVQAIEDALDTAAPTFFVNIGNGHLYYDGGRFDFEVQNGNLMWGLTV